ncbi:G-type lectin S-receptor-like serine threonine-kinase RLK1 [Olea europaea subsp. europaea]|uniref:non-specific serine/threonine protein kinase n=1 Tax=Olea europaea subsp. europaea TaxID=158383 RepID=A0A8S0UWP4_OLEEU|nr:G-type lectin S-receptor-like serine threonine-kinase RLK1 [Olea europaea subsp. europaea]
MFQLAIWYNKIPEKTLVWYPNVKNPIPRDSRVEIEAQSGLVLSDPQGRRIWSTENIIVDVVYHGFFNDSGNFVLVRSDSVSIWESFKYPTDTVLATQIIEIDVKLLILQMHRILVINWSSMKGVRFMYERNEERKALTVKRSIPPTSDHYYRATLDFDGVFRTYYYPKSSDGDQEWTVAEYWPQNICMEINGQKGSGACGYNGFCRLENGRPICQCPPGYFPSEPDNQFSDCNPTFIPICSEGNQKGSAEDEYMLNVSDVDWPFSDFEQLAPFREGDCINACLNDCLCAVSIYRDNSCWKKKLPMSNGRLDTQIGAKAFFKFRKGDIPVRGPNFPTPEKKKKDKGTLILVGSVLLGSSLFINFMLVGAVCLGFFLIYNKKITNFSPSHRRVQGANFRCFTYKMLAQATDGFKEELGRGAFGIVYKGVMPTGPNSTIAVKKLDRVAQDTEKEFKTEVNVIGQTHHENLVRLLGFCEEGPHRMLVYEYMNNGTLASFLFGDLKPNWNRRIQIALGTARGLAYLHEECSTQIIHCDIKPQNILLDEYFNAWISDFGLAKLLMMNQSRTLTNIREKA